MNINFDVDAALAHISTFIQQHGPQAIDAMAAVVQVTAIGHLIWGGFCLLVAIIGGCSVRPLLKKAEKLSVEYYTSDLTGPYIFGACTISVISVILFFVSLYHLFDIWNWAALWNPRLALMHSIWAGLQDAASAANNR